MENISKKSVLSVFIEATVVGIGLILFVNLLIYFKDKIPNFSGYRDRVEIFFIAGFLFHVICEYTGINLWYAKEYCKML